MNPKHIHQRDALAMSPRERLELAERLHEHAFELLRASPSGLAAFVKRNHHQRRDRPENRIKTSVHHSAAEGASPQDLIDLENLPSS